MYSYEIDMARDLLLGLNIQVTGAAGPSGAVGATPMTPTTPINLLSFIMNQKQSHKIDFQ